jgi:hypothetical protein
MLDHIELPSSVDQIPLPPLVKILIHDAQRRIEAFQDCWEKSRVEQFVAADYQLVYQTLGWLRQTHSLIGNRFLEWGCGFAVVSALASQLGFDAIGIEAEEVLLQRGRETIAAGEDDVELIHGNFLPPGAESLADDPTLPSLGHRAASAYELLEMDLDDFAIVYAYPWPGEDDFHEAVFDHYAAIGALLVLFCGPNEMRIWRKRT